MTKTEIEFNVSHGVTEQQLIALQAEVQIIRERERNER